jgi:hypothetical protein
MVKASAIGAQDENRGIANFQGVIKGQFEVGFVLFGRVALQVGPGAGEFIQFFIRERVKIADDVSWGQAKRKSVARPAISGNQHVVGTDEASGKVRVGLVAIGE